MHQWDEEIDGRSFTAALDAAWKPYLDGKGTLDDALIALLKAQPAG